MKEEIANWLNQKIKDIIGYDEYPKYDYADNFRFALKDSEREVRAYEEKQDRGCCGSYDGEVKCPIDGRTYLIGFNYGH